MDRDDEQLLRRRVYGADHDDPNPGPLPHRTYAELVGGPLDGLLLDIHGWRTMKVDDGVAVSGRIPHTGPGGELPLLLLRRHALSTRFWTQDEQAMPLLPDQRALRKRSRNGHGDRSANGSHGVGWSSGVRG